MRDRGMMKWKPFASLTEYDSYYQKMLEEKKKVSKPLISEDEAEEINTILVNSTPGVNLEVKFFAGGFIRTKIGSLIKVDPYEKRLFLDNLVVPFDNLLSISKV